MKETVKRVRSVVVDDSPATRRILISILKDTPAEVVAEADDVESALEVCKRERPELVFLDVVMPGGSGVDVLQQVKERLPAARVLMVTSIDKRDTVTSCREFGAVGYILKPFSREQVLERVRGLCAEIRGGQADAHDEEGK